MHTSTSHRNPWNSLLVRAAKRNESEEGNAKKPPLTKRLATYLKEHGPTASCDLKRVLGVTSQQLRCAVARNKQVALVDTRAANRVEPRSLSEVSLHPGADLAKFNEHSLAGKVRDLLLLRGGTTLDQIYRQLSEKSESVRNCIYANRHVFKITRLKGCTGPRKVYYAVYQYVGSDRVISAGEPPA